MLAVLLTAHHAGLHETHAGASAGDGMTMAGHAPLEPASEVLEVVAACAAVLPFVVALAGLLALLPGSLRRLPSASVETLSWLAPGIQALHARAGPRFLCVMRC